MGTKIHNLPQLIRFLPQNVKERHYDYFLFHRANHGFDELDFLVRQPVLLVQFLVSPRLAEVLEGNEQVTTSGNILSILY